MSKLKAFTLLEMIVVMILTLLVSGIAFQAYQIVAKQYYSFRISMKRNNELLLFERTLLQDISGAEYVQKTQEGIECVLPDRNISYNFENDYVLRAITVPDTFFLKVENDSAFFFSKKNISIGDIIQKLSFSIIIEGEKLDYTFAKTYGADVLMKFNP